MLSKLAASDRTALLRLAGSLPVGDENRRAILSSLKKAGEEVDAFWRNYGNLEAVSLYTGMAIARLWPDEIHDEDRRWLAGTANRAHAVRAKICGQLLKRFADEPTMVEAIPLLKLCRAAAGTIAKAQTWRPGEMNYDMEKAVSRIVPVYLRLKSHYPAAASVLDDLS